MLPFFVIFIPQLVLPNINYLLMFYTKNQSIYFIITKNNLVFRSIYFARLVGLREGIPYPVGTKLNRYKIKI